MSRAIKRKTKKQIQEEKLEREAMEAVAELKAKVQSIVLIETCNCFGHVSNGATNNE